MATAAKFVQPIPIFFGLVDFSKMAAIVMEMAKMLKKIKKK
jgi:hypothetical protein